MCCPTSPPTSNDKKPQRQNLWKCLFKKLITSVWFLYAGVGIESSESPTNWLGWFNAPITSCNTPAGRCMNPLSSKDPTPSIFFCDSQSLGLSCNCFTIFETLMPVLMIRMLSKETLQSVWLLCLPTHTVENDFDRFKKRFIELHIIINILI